MLAITYLHNLVHSEVEQPLEMFQHTLAQKEDTLRLLQGIRKVSKSGYLTEEGLNKLFEKMWPELEAAIESAPPSVAKSLRDIRDVSEETLGVTREVARRQQEIAEEGHALLTNINNMIFSLSLRQGTLSPHDIRSSFINAGVNVAEPVGSAYGLSRYEASDPAINQRYKSSRFTDPEGGDGKS